MATEQHIETVEGTERVEVFSDGVIAIIITILILEIHVPEIKVLTNAGAWEAIVPIIPKLVSFLLSFVTVAVFWVNHHHFFYIVKKSDASLLWYNNHLLFWLAVIPFVTAFLGDYPTLPLVVSLYGFVLFMGSFAFSLMSYYIFFKSKLLPESITVSMRTAQFRRSLFGVGLYASSTLLAFVNVYVSLALFLIVPIYYFLPQLVKKRQV